MKRFALLFFALTATAQSPNSPKPTKPLPSLVQVKLLRGQVALAQALAAEQKSKLDAILAHDAAERAESEISASVDSVKKEHGCIDFEVTEAEVKCVVAAPSAESGPPGK